LTDGFAELFGTAQDGNSVAYGIEVDDLNA
jgi:hypothetical protein